jgi:hypothetical protein
MEGLARQREGLSLPSLFKVVAHRRLPAAAVCIALATQAGCAGQPRQLSEEEFRRQCPPPRRLSEEELKNLKPQGVKGPYLRVCERFSKPIRSALLRGPVSALFLVCVHPEGFVYDVEVVESSGSTLFEEVTINDIKNYWRYKPLMNTAGVAAPFCHPIRVVWKGPPAHEVAGQKPRR